MQEKSKHETMIEPHFLYSQYKLVGIHREIRNKLIKSNKKQLKKNFFNRKLLDIWIIDMIIIIP